jgi:hypothetical protein
MGLQRKQGSPMSSETYVVRVTYKSAKIELHEFKHKKKALEARDKFRKMEEVESAKMMLKSDTRRLGETEAWGGKSKPPG